MSIARCLAFLTLVMLISSALPMMASTNDSDRSLSREDTFDGPATRAQVPNMDGNISYAIITPSQFKTVLEPLKQMKTQKGVKAEIFELHNGSVGILDVYTDNALMDDAERIHEFLRDLDQMNPSLEWVLLVGDTDLLPSRLMYLNGSVSTNYEEVSDDVKQFAISDYYYAGLNSTWNVNPNPYFGEEGETDYTPEVYVGRLPVNTISEAQRAVGNILDYELDPEPGYWYRSFLLCGAVMDTPNLLDYPPNRDLEYKWYKDNGYEVTQKLQALLPSQMVNFSLYDYGRLQGGNYSPFYDTLNHTNARTYWDVGNSLVNFASHGYENGDAVVHYQGDGDTFFKLDLTALPYFDYEDAYGCKNGQRLSMLYASACGVGNFSETDDTNLERLLYAPGGGAIGVIAGSAESTWRCEFEENDSSYGNWWLDQEFWRLLLGGYFQPGKALYQSKVNYGAHIADPQNPHRDYPYKTYYKTNRLAYNLLGDPEVPIWTDVPQVLNVSYPKPYYINNQTLTMKIVGPDGRPVKSAKICVYGEDVYATVMSGDDGLAALPMSLARTQVLNLTVTAHNFLRYEDKIDVISVCDLTYNASNFTCDKQYPMLGESVGISVEVQNIGPIAISNFSVGIYAGDPLSGGTPIGSFEHQALGPDSAKAFTAEWAIEGGITDIFVWIDRDGIVMEVNEANNIGHITVRENVPVSWLTNFISVVMQEDTLLSSDLSASPNLMQYAKNPDFWPQPLAFEITNVSNAHCNVSLLKLPSGAVHLEAMPEHDWFGAVNVTVIATDGPTSAQAVISITVTNEEDPPMFLTSTYFEVREGVLSSLFISAADSDSENVSLSCVNSTLNVTAVDLGNGTLRVDINPTNAEVGVQVLRLAAIDGSNNTVYQVVEVLVENVNNPPFFLEPAEGRAFKMRAGSDFALHVRAQDPDLRDQLTYEDNSGMFEINSSTGLIEFSPGDPDIGRHVVTVWAVDSNGSRASINITFEVQGGADRVSDTYAVMLIFALCVIVITVISLIFYRKRKSSQGPDIVSEEKEPQETERKMSIEEWSKMDADIEELTGEPPLPEGGPDLTPGDAEDGLEAPPGPAGPQMAVAEKKAVKDGAAQADGGDATSKEMKPRRPDNKDK